MSRSRHQKYRQNGVDLWSRRQGGHLSKCKDNRQITTRKERNRDREMETEALRTQDYVEEK